MKLTTNFAAKTTAEITADLASRRRLNEFISLVIVETPFRGRHRRHRVQNETYAKLALYDSMMRGEVPVASHLLYPQILDEDDPDERALGIELAICLGLRFDTVAFYIDYGMTPGMKLAYDSAYAKGKSIEKRTLWKK